MSTGTWRWAPILLPSVAEPKPMTWSTGQEGYSHCFWCWRGLVVGDLLWGCNRCNAENFECARAFAEGMDQPLQLIQDLVRDSFERPEAWLPVWTPAYDVVPL